jgi:hypothetical protein
MILCAMNSWALGGTDGLPSIPTAGVLPHSAYQLHGELAWQRVPESGEYSSAFPWVSGVRLGLFDRAEFGVEVGSKISVSGKMQFLQEQDWFPSLSFGARQIFNSQEAHFYSVPDSLRTSYAGELYMVASKKFFGVTSLNGGMSVVPGLDSGMAELFWGVSQGLFGGLELVYDGLQRNDDLHHALGLSWSFRDFLRISVGAKEVDRFFYQNEQFGFYMRDRENRSPDGYSAPGIWTALSFTGFMSSGSQPSTPERLIIFEKRLDSQSKNTEKYGARVDRLELQIQEMRKGSADSVTIKELIAERMLQDLVKGLTDETWDPRQGRRLQDSLLSLGEVSNRILVRTVQRESSSLEYRLLGLRIMGSSQSPRFVAELAEVLSSAEVALVREAVLALAKIGTPEALDLLRVFRPKANPEMQKNIDEILKSVIPATPIAPAVLTPAPPPVPVPTSSGPAL